MCTSVCGGGVKERERGKEYSEILKRFEDHSSGLFN